MMSALREVRAFYELFLRLYKFIVSFTRFLASFAFYAVLSGGKNFWIAFGKCVVIWERMENLFNFFNGLADLLVFNDS